MNRRKEHIAALRAIADEMGARIVIRLSGGGHLRLAVSYGKRSGLVFTAGSPSDVRGVKNARSVLRNTILRLREGA